MLAPAINGVGQLNTACAYLWAIPGATLYLPPFGIVEITGVAGNIISYKNLTVPQGTNILSGSPMLQGAPSVAAGASNLSTNLDRLSGFLAGQQMYLVGTARQSLRWVQSGANVFLQNVDGMIFLPNPNYNVELGAEDVGGDAFATTPFAGPGTGGSAYYDLPNLPPTPLLPTIFWVKVHIRISVAGIDTTAANSFLVEHNGVEVMAMTYQFAEHVEVLLPVTGTQLKLDFTKLNAKTNCYARVRVIGYYF